ncbi:MAG: hypothetical protein EBE86_018230 [Hormoscilla sp. GUM202]|nr:hypothetical protein [Hormoscilla sp. GUM202]
MTVLIADTLSFQEFMNRESLPLATLHGAVFEFLRDREDVVVFGAQAVNAYVGEPRMTQDIDVLSLQAADLAEELRSYLSERFYIAVRVRMVKGGLGYRLYRVEKQGNRHLMDIRQVEKLPANRCIEQVLVMDPTELVVSKIISYHQRRGKPKAGYGLARFGDVAVNISGVKGGVWCSIGWVSSRRCGCICGVIMARDCGNGN